MKEIILKSKIFKNIEENEVDLLLKCINNYRKTFKKGEIILREGEKNRVHGDSYNWQRRSGKSRPLG